MKKLLRILIALLIVSCQNNVQSKLTEQNIVLTDSVSSNSVALDSVVPFKVEEYEVKVDSLTIKSRPFELNNLLCFWEHYIEIYDNNRLYIEATLYDFKTKKALISYEESPKYPEYYQYQNPDTYFSNLTSSYFKDLNFDGYLDYTTYYGASMPMTSVTVIHLFNNEIKTFEESDLSDTVIDEVDSINKILTTHSWNPQEIFYKKYHFDNSGNIKFREVIIESSYFPNDTTEITIRDYSKIIREDVVESRIDTIK